jgi:hypothetical protein
MRDRVRVYDKKRHFNSDSTASTVGRAFYIHFFAYNEDPAQFTIIADDEDSPEAADPETGELPPKVEYLAETPVPFSKNLFFDPIPFEML